MSDDMNQGSAPQNSQYVAFNLRDEEYGVSILNVQEIRNLTDITRVPFAADFIKGVINLRGSVLPVIDLKKRLGLAETPYTERTRIVTVSVEDVHVGMLVDAVTEVLSLENAPVDTKEQPLPQRDWEHQRKTHCSAQPGGDCRDSEGSKIEIASQYEVG